MNKKKLGGFLAGLAGLAAAIVAANQPHHSTPAPVPTPSVPAYTVVAHVCAGDCAADHKIPGATLAIDGQPTVIADGAGNGAFANLPAGRYSVCAKADGYKPLCIDRAVPADGDVSLGLEADIPPVSAVHLDGKTLRLADGRAWPWRYASAFTILARSDGEQDAFLNWAQGRHFTGIRLLTTAVLLADLPPDVGRARLPGLLEKLRVRGMGAEVVALADTQPRGMSRGAMREHVAGVAAIVAGYPLPLTVELANENAHPTQQGDLQDVSFLLELRRLVPASVPVSLGSSCCSQDDTSEHYPGGDYSTPHRDRSRALFQEVARVKHLIEDFRLFAVDDEPIGAAEADDPGKRSAQPERFFAQGVLDALGGVGATFHSSAGLTATVPGPVTDASAAAFVAGATIAPDGQVFRFVNDSAGDGVTRGADWSQVFKLFAFINRDASQSSYLVALGVTGDYHATFANGWHQVRVVAERPGVQVIEVQR